MNPDVFFENFELLADAPNGVQKLRELILQLAVMGKLVPQDPNDEPANVLSRKNAKSLRPMQEDEIPFDYPKGWIFTRMDQVSDAIHYGYTASANNSLKDIRLLRITDIQSNRVNWETVPGCEIDNQKLNSYALKNNDLLIARTGGTIGKSYLVENLAVKAVFASYLIRIVPNNLIFPKYLKLYADSPLYWDQLYSKCSGTGQPNVNATSLKSLILPLPPLAEQKRIVSKIDELMTLCDKLESRRQKKQEIQSKLNSAALDRMLSAENQEEFEQYWQRICENFDLLYDNPENVEKLRQAILQLAVQGKLVPQNPEDEPASVLIEKIKIERERLAKKGEIKKNKSFSSIGTEEIPSELPKGWTLEYLVNIVLDFQNGTSKRNSIIGEPVPVLRLADIKNGKLCEDSVREINLTKQEALKYKVDKGDILVIRVNGSENLVGRFIPCLVNGKWAYCDHLIRVKLPAEYIDQSYLRIYAESFKARSHILQKTITTAGQKTINQVGLGSLQVLIPPLAEQKRIVEKIEQLMGLCDELEAKLRKEREDSEKLMEAVVKGLLEGADTEKTELEKPIPLQVAAIKLK